MQMAFQLGRSSLLEFEDARQEIWDEDWEGTAREMRNSLWHRQTPERCDRMSDAFENDDASGWRQAEDPYDGG
jgi:lysozyme